jgi:hypothetical protein
MLGLSKRAALASIYRHMPDRMKYAAFQARFGSAIAARSGLGRLPVLQHRAYERECMTELEKVNNRLVIRLNLELLLSERRVFNLFWKRLPLMISFFTRTGPHVRQTRADISDGGDFGRGTMGICSTNADASLVPDRQFMSSRHYAPYRRLATANPENWNSRQGTVLWRGSASDKGEWKTAAMKDDDPQLKPRIRMCLKLRGVAGADAKITAAPYAPPGAVEELKRCGISGEFIPEKTWFQHKFALAIDGFTYPSALFPRLLLGCCVLKIDSPASYKQWFHEGLVPWKHYIPVQFDLSDLHERIAWCRSQDSECRAIAAAGQAYAWQRTVESETAATMARLNVQLADPVTAQRLSGAGPSGST